MAPSSTRGFYAELTPFSRFAAFHRPENYRQLPADWYVVITDIADSTAAIEQGRYKEINALGVASIVALINALKPVTFPYVFGGDGATACVPGERIEQVTRALRASREMAREGFGLELRAGLVPVSTLHERGVSVKVAKFQPHPWYSQAMFTGGGVALAERLVKQTAEDNPYLVTGQGDDTDDHFSGFECRWREVPSPNGETVSLLVQALPDDEAERGRLYAEIEQSIITIYGDEARHHPLRQELMKLTGSLSKLWIETKLRTAWRGVVRRLGYLIKLKALAYVGRYLMARGIETDSTDWGQYKHNLIINSDYRKFDEMLRMVISGTAQQRRSLEQVLQRYRSDGLIAYGMHSSDNTLITCIVNDYDKDHVHFLDGADGGYALAAKQLKGHLEMR